MMNKLSPADVADPGNAFVGGGGGFANCAATGTAPNAAALGGVAPSGYQVALPVAFTFSTTAMRIGGLQVITTRQTGLGSVLPSTHCGATYTATEQGLINTLIDKVVAMETILRAHGLATT